VQSTGEANTEAMRATGGDDMDDFISAPKVKWQSVRSLHLQCAACTCACKCKLRDSLVVAVLDMLLREIWWGLPTCHIVQPPRYHRNGCVVID